MFLAWLAFICQKSKGVFSYNARWGQRTPDTRSETVPSSRITPDLQIHSFSSSVHLTHLLQGSGQRTPDTRSETFLHPESLQIFRFTASPLQFTSLIFYRFRSENTWHEIRDHSFIQNHSRSSDSQLLLFSSLIFYRVQIREHLTRDQRPFLHPESLQIFRFTASPLQFTHLLQGSGQRTPDTRSETIPSCRITPDLQIHSFSSSVHSLIFYRVQFREHLTRDQRPFLHPESLQIFRFTASPLQFTHSSSTGSVQRTPDTRSETIPSSRITPDPSDSQLLLFSSLTHLLQGPGQRTPDTRSETIPSSRITPDLQIHSFSSSVHSSSTGFRSENTWHEIRDHSFIQNHSRSFRFTASSLQFTHSSSTGSRSENTWHEIRDHSFIQNHSRSSDSQLLLFSSLIFYRVQIREHLTRDQRPFLHPESLQIFRFTASPLQFTRLLQGSDQRTPDTRSETIPSSRITPDLQIHSFSSSVHSSSTGFRSENTWHEIRDHSFIQNHSRSSDSQLLLFSSLIFYRVQIREHLTRDQRPFLHPESLQIFRFTASSLQFTHSSSTGSRSENTWHEIRDHSFIQNHSRSSDSQLLLFSSPHSSSTGFRSENTWHEIRDHSFIQNHSRSSDSQLLLFSSPHSSSTGSRSENTWHEIRDHSFIQNHSRSSDSQLLLFSSPHSSSTGSGQRTPDTRSETIPSSRITPDLQIHSFFSSVHSLIFYRVQIREHLTRDQRPFLHPESLQILQIHSFFSSVHSSSTGIRSENTWPVIRDHSFIQNHSRSSDSQLLLFSSLTHLLQGSGQRTPDKRSETIPSSRITPDLQIHSFFSSVHSLIFYRDQIREHLTRDQRPFLHPESLQIFRFTASPLQFTHLLQGSDQRTPDTRSETIPSSRITPDLQIHSFSSSVHSSSTGFRSENTWHEIRDHSFIQNHSRSSDSQLLLFSSLTHLLQGSGQRTPDTRSETIPSSRITPDLQIHSFFSSVHSLIFYRIQVREHLTRDQRPFLHPESLQIFRFTASSLQFTHSSSTGFSSENTWHEIRDHSFIQNHSRSSDSQLLLFSSPHSSSTGIRSENTWHEIRDHSFIQNHSRSSDSQLLLFSSLTHLLQGSGQRTPDTRSETIPSSRITPDLQIHSFSSSVHSLIFYRVQIREHLTRDQRPFLHPESLQIFRFTASPLQFTSLIFYRVQFREHLTRDQRPFLHPESLQIFRYTASPLQFTSLIFYRFRSEDWNGQQKLGFVLSYPCLCCFWGLCLDYCTVGRSKHGPL